MEDGSGATSTATVTVTIVSANDAPTAVADKATVQEDSPAVTIDVLADDTDPDKGDSKTVLSIDTEDALGKVTIADSGDVSYDPELERSDRSALGEDGDRQLHLHDGGRLRRHLDCDSDGDDRRR